MKSINSSSLRPAHKTGVVSGGRVHAGLEALGEDGWLLVKDPDGSRIACLWLDTGATLAPPLQPGDMLLVLRGEGDLPAVALGRIGSYHMPSGHLNLCAAESIRLVCGQASINLSADGKLMIRGEDVLVRAKGTQRIRAGTVSIN